jgi:hypothetical protein
MTSFIEMTSGGGLIVNSGDLAGKCFAGTYCPSGMTRQPDLLREACPRGYYCPVAVPSPLPCPAGRYGLSSGLGDLNDCSLTPQGYFTIEAAQNVSGLCEPGFYCPAGSSGPRAVPCPARHYRPEYGAGSATDCSLCVAGGYCLEASAQPLVCPKGFYCPTGISEPVPCPPGSFGSSFGLRKVEECNICGPGAYCDGYGLTDVRGLCSPGFYCISGCNTSTPYALSIRNDTGIGFGDICPVGHYCPSGSGLPTPCPPGRFNSHTGRTSPGECDICSPGFFCAGLGNSKPSGPCEAGYYCPAGSTSSQEIESPPGKFSLAIASVPSECLPGFYNSMFGQDSCLPCPTGYYCPNSSLVTYEYTICPIGHFCPPQSQFPQRCPIGTYSNDIGLSLQSQCLPCTPGSFCGSSGLHEVSGPCAAGYYCTIGAQLSTHDTIPDSTGGQCPTGHF